MALQEHHGEGEDDMIGEFESAGQPTPSGWYPDPHISGTMRYWDGGSWSEHTASGYDHVAPFASSVQGVARSPYAARPQGTFVDANKQSLIALGFAAAYVVLAMTAGIVMLGIIPFMAGVRALQRREPLAPLAMIGAAGAVALGVLAIAA